MRCVPVRQHGRTHSPIRLSFAFLTFFENLRASSSRMCSLPFSVLRSHLLAYLHVQTPNGSMAKEKRKPFPFPVAQCLRHVLSPSSPTVPFRVSSFPALVSLGMTIEPEGPEFDRMSNSTSTGGMGFDHAISRMDLWRLFHRGFPCS